ncbi:hypothetical protein NKH18_00275 [Streptomyces sp. M10(2022)]
MAAALPGSFSYFWTYSSVMRSSTGAICSRRVADQSMSSGRRQLSP